MLDILSQEQTVALIKKYQEENDIESRNKVVLHYIRLIEYLVITKFNISKRSIHYEAVREKSVFALLRSIDKYDINKDVKFLTFSYTCICNAIASYLKYNVNKGQIKKRQFVVSLDEMLENGNIDFYGYEVNQYNEDVLLEILNDQNQLTEILKLIDTLLPRDKMILIKYFGINCTEESIGEIAKEYAVSRSFVGEIKQRAMERLFSLLSKNSEFYIGNFEYNYACVSESNEKRRMRQNIRRRKKEKQQNGFKNTQKN